MRVNRLSSILLFVTLFAGCVVSSPELDSARGLFLQGRYIDAGKTIEEGMPDAGRNELLYLLEAGSCFHAGSDYVRSNANLERADELARINNYVSISEEAASLVLDDRIKVYRSPEYERFFLLYMLAINRFMSGNVEKALVELRRIAEFEEEVAVGKKKWLRQPLAHYLAGLSYLRFGEYDNARWEFNKAYEFAPENPSYRAAAQGVEQLLISQPSVLNFGWALVFVETGYAPHRKPLAGFTAIPMFESSASLSDDASVSVSVDGNEACIVDCFSLEKTAEKWLDEKALYYLSKEIGSVLARKVLSDQIGKAVKGKDAEEMAFLALLLARQPDLRSWKNLPQKLSVFCIPLDKGKHLLSARIAGSSGFSFREERKFDIVKGLITPIIIRCMR